MSGKSEISRNGRTIIKDRILEKFKTDSNTDLNTTISGNSEHITKETIYPESKSFTSVVTISSSDTHVPSKPMILDNTEIDSELNSLKNPNFKLEFMIRSGRLITLQDKQSVIQEMAWLEANAVDGYQECMENEECAMWKDSDWRQINKIQQSAPFYKKNWVKVHKNFIPICERSPLLHIVQIHPI